MVEDHKTELTESRKLKRKVALMAAFLIALLCISFIPIASFGMGPNFITPGDIIKEGAERRKEGARRRAEKKREKKYLKKIEELEKKGGQEGAEGLWEIINGPDSYSIRRTAIVTLGRLKRPEDGLGLIKWADWSLNSPYERERPRYYSSVVTALGEIGSPEACQFLNEFIREKTKKFDYKIDIKPLARAILKGSCMTEEEVLKVVWGYAKNMWSTQLLQESSLEFLKETEDKEAEARLTRYQLISDNCSKLSYSMEESRDILLDREIPWRLKFRIMDHFQFMRGSKEELLDAYFTFACTLVNSIFKEVPEFHQQGEYCNLESWGVTLVEHRYSHWTRTNVEDYLEAKREYYRKNMDEEVFPRMDKMITNILERNKFIEKKKAEFKAWEEAKKAKSKKVPALESRFVSLESSLREVELFVFDKEINWAGLVQVDSFLASILAEMKMETDDERKKELQEKALMAIMIEKKLPGEFKQSPFPPLMFIPIDYEEKDEKEELQWSPENRGFSLDFKEGETRLLLIQAFEDTKINISIDLPLESASGGEETSYCFTLQKLPKNSWVIAEVRTDQKEPLVFISTTGESLDQRFRLLPDETMQEESIKGDEEEARIMDWFLSARKTLEEYEEKTLEKAGGSSGIKDFRKELLKMINELKEIEAAD